MQKQSQIQRQDNAGRQLQLAKEVFYAVMFSLERLERVLGDIPPGRVPFKPGDPNVRLTDQRLATAAQTEPRVVELTLEGQILIMHTQRQMYPLVTSVRPTRCFFRTKFCCF